LISYVFNFSVYVCEAGHLIRPTATTKRADGKFCVKRLFLFLPLRDTAKDAEFGDEFSKNQSGEHAKTKAKLPSTQGLKFVINSVANFNFHECA
jgi:hypothetical protein